MHASLAHSRVNQVLELQPLAEAVDELAHGDLNTQMILRIGWADRVAPPAPRRDLADVLLVD